MSVKAREHVITRRRVPTQLARTAVSARRTTPEMDTNVAGTVRRAFIVKT